jgi:secretion/DNA translocation related TadE-like protein
MTAHCRDDQGVATLLGLALALVLAGAGVVISGLVAVHVTHQRASVAADLAALAAAARGCDVADRVARAHGAIPMACAVEGSDAVVTVALPAPALLARLASWAGREAPVVPSSSRAGTAG